MTYLKLYNFILDWFENEPIINTISYKKEEQIDTNVNCIYPLANFYINSNTPNQYNQYNVLITLLDQVDVNSKVNNSKLIDSTNSPDIVNELEQVMLRFIAYLQMENNDALVTRVDDNAIEFLDNGVQLEMVFEIHNGILNYK